MKNGERKPFLFTGIRVEIDGKPHLVGIGIDISDRIQAEASLTQLRRELMHISRITTLGELTSTLAHELNQPLTAILSNAQAVQRWLAGQNPDLEDIGAAMEDIVRDDKRAGEIIHGLRAMIRKGEIEHQRLDMNTLVQSVAQLLHSELIVSDVPLELMLDPELPAIEAGQTEVQQILLNLMVNGIQAQRTTEPGTRRLRVTTRQDAGNVIVAIRDHGVGIPTDQLPLLFDPFFTTKKGGLGMGLAICRRIAEVCHGKIWAENNPDGGATFYLALPIAESRA